MDCPLNNTFLLTFRTLVWRLLYARALTVVSCCGIFLNPSWQYSKRQTRGEEIEKCLYRDLEPTYHFSIFNESYMVSSNTATAFSYQKSMHETFQSR